MSVFESKKCHLQEVLLYFFSVKKSAVESYQLLLKAYDEIVLSETTLVTGGCDWFRRFKSDFDVEDKERAKIDGKCRIEDII